MNVLLRALVGYGGLVTGLLIMSRTAHWISAIYQAVASGRGSSTRTALGLTAVLLLHSGPWLLVAAAIFAYAILPSPHHAEWIWFFSGVLAAPLVNAAILFRFLRLRRKRRSAAKPSEGRPGERE